MDNIMKIKKTAGKFRVVFLALMVVSPFVPVIVWMCYNGLPSVMKLQMFADLHVPMTVELSLRTRILAGAASLIPGAVLMAGLLYLVRLFGLYARGMIFTAENVACYRKLGHVILWSMAASIVHSSLMTIVLTLDNPPGQRMISFGISSSEIARLLIGMIVLLVSWIMEAGREIQEEQQLTV